MGIELDVKARDGSGAFKSYLVESNKPPQVGIARSGLVIVQDVYAVNCKVAIEAAGTGAAVVEEIYGINKDVRDKTDYWGAMGYDSIAPDLFWRLGPDGQSAKQDEHGLAIHRKFDVDKGVEDIQAAIDLLRERGCQRVGVIGFSLGGLLAYLAAARTDSDATVSYYGVGIDKYLGEADKIAKPLACHLAQEDEYIGEEVQSRIREALGKHPKVRLYNYPYVRHAFARPGRNHDRCADTLAEHRTGEFFYMNLKLSKAAAA